MQMIFGLVGIIFVLQFISIEFVCGDDVIFFVLVNGIIMVMEEGFVWFGDINFDGIVNNLDVLLFGLVFGVIGL